MMREGYGFPTWVILHIAIQQDAMETTTDGADWEKMDAIGEYSAGCGSMADIKWKGIWCSGWSTDNTWVKGISLRIRIQMKDKATLMLP